MRRLSLCPELNDRQFILVMRQLSNRFAAGGNASVFLGPGYEYLQSRLYHPGDPVRLIDWRAMARTGRPYLKQYDTQTNTPVFLVVDNSASMTFSEQELSKYAVAALLAGGIAFASLAGGNPVSIMATGARVASRPTFSTSELANRLRALRNYSTNNRVGLGAALGKLREMLTCRSYVVILSDMHDECAVAQVKAIAVGHETNVIRLTDPLEADPIRAGFVRLRAAEHAHLGTVSPNARLERASDPGEMLRLAGVQVLDVDQNQAFDPQVRVFLHKTARIPWKVRLQSRF